MDADAYAKNNVPEKGALPGTYKHENTDEVLEVTTFAAADAVVRQGWRFVAPLRPADVRAKEAAQRQAEADKAAGISSAQQPVSQDTNTKGNK